MNLTLASRPPTGEAPSGNCLYRQERRMFGQVKPRRGFCFLSYLASVLSLMMLSASVPAQGQSLRESVVFLIGTTKSSMLFERVGAQMDTAFENAVQSMDVEPAQQAIVEKHYDRFKVLKRERLSWTAWQDTIIERYLAEFTEPEIRALVAFYESPLGRKFIEKEPILSRVSLDLAQSSMQVMLPELREILNELNTQIARTR